MSKSWFWKCRSIEYLL